jgi:hypothetical protein
MDNLDQDAFSNIGMLLTIKDQIYLHMSCKRIWSYPYYNYEENKIFGKFSNIIRNCCNIMIKKYPDDTEIGQCLYCGVHRSSEMCNASCKSWSYYYYYSNNIYSKILTRYDHNIRKEKRLFTSYTKFYVLGKPYDYNGLVNNIELLMIIEYLYRLLNMSRDLNMSLANIDISYLPNNNFNYLNFNRKLNKFFNTDDWTDVVEDMICGKILMVYSLKELEQKINPLLECAYDITVDYHIALRKMMENKNRLTKEIFTGYHTPQHKKTGQKNVKF